MVPPTKPLQFEKLRGKKEASLVDKSSFSSWLHTAAGGLTCHRRIQPLIHLCFPLVFLNFTHSSRAITESEVGLLSAQKACAWPVQPEANSVMWEPWKSPALLTGRQKRRICHFSKNAAMFVCLRFAFRHFLVSYFLPFHSPFQSTPLSKKKKKKDPKNKKTPANPPPNLSACPSASQRSGACPLSLSLSQSAVRIKHLSRWSSFRP